MELISQVTIDDSVYLATDLIKLAEKKQKTKDKRRKSQFSKILNNTKTCGSVSLNGRSNVSTAVT